MVNPGFYALLVATAAALPQTPAATPTPTPQTATPTPDPQAAGPPPEFIAAAQAFGQCVGSGGPKVAPTATPEAAAKEMLAGCTDQKTALETRFEAWITGPGFPEAGRTQARQAFRTQIDGVEPQIVASIRASRAGAAAPAPSATPAPKPAPSR